MIRMLKRFFCRHEWRQSYWGGLGEHGVICKKCGTIQYRKGPGGPLPEGVSQRQPDNGTGDRNG